MSQRVFNIFLLMLILVFGSSQKIYSRYVKTKIILTEGGEIQQRLNISQTLTKVIQEINKKAAGIGNLNSISNYCTIEGFQSIVDLAKYDKIYSNLIKQETNLIIFTISDIKYFEVRNIKINIGQLSSKSATITKNLVFTLKEDGIIIGLHYALEENNYNKILNKGKETTDEAQRKEIIRFLERFQTAYNRKDLAYLENVFSDRALIIAGLVVKESEQNDDFLQEHSNLNQGQIRLIKLSKNQYFERFRERVFKENSWINVKFDDIKIIKHNSVPYIYGVELFQRYDSEYYSDRGHLFLMFDFKNKELPLIHVRCWQERPFEDGSYIGLYDFQLSPNIK